MKKLLTLALVVVMALSLVACSGGGAASSGGKTVALSTTSDGSIDYDNLGELPEVKLSMSVLDADKHGKHARNEFVKEKFNLSFEYIPVSWGDWNEKIQTWVATDDLPDILNWDLKIASSTNYFDWAKQGAFAPLTEDEIKQYSHLYNFYKDSPSCEAYKVDGTLYCWPSSRSNPPEIDNAYTSYFCIRKDWAKAVGLYQEDNEYTWEEWKALLKAIVDQDPGKNGIANAALVMPTWGFPNAAVTFLNAPAAEGNETSSYIVVDGEYKWPASLPEFRTAVVETWNMYQDGLIYKDNISFTGNEADDMFKAGQAFAHYNVVGSMNSWTDDMLRDGIISSKDDVGYAVVYGMDGNWYMTQTEDYWSVSAFSHKISDEKKQRALMFWDYLWTNEGIRLRWLGIEGKDYKVTGDGLKDVEILWDFDENTKTYISPYANDAFNEANGGCNTPPGNPADAQFQEDLKNEVWAKMAEGKAVIKKVDYAMSALNAENKNKYGTFGADVKEEMIKILADPNCDPGAEWDAWVESMMPTVQLVLDELNTQILGK